MANKVKSQIETIVLTPELALELLEHNTQNRPISEPHVKRIAGQITKGKWRFNGDTIKISDDGTVLDGQHRLWAIAEAKKPVDTIIVRGVQRDAFATIDTIRRHRTGGDTLSLLGVERHRRQVSSALAWLIRWQRGVIETYRDPKNKIENSDIEAAFAENPNIGQAVARCMKLHDLGNPGVFGFVYYVLSNQDSDLADIFLEKLLDPTSLGVSHPLYQFRAWLLNNAKKRDPEHVIALAFKALNAVAARQKISGLKWSSQGRRAEKFPQLNIRASAKPNAEHAAA